MHPTTHALMAVLVVLALLAAAPMAATATAQDDEETDADEPEIEPGEQLAGIVGVQDAEFEGDIAERAFGLKVAKAASENARADVVAEQLGDVEERIAALEERQAELQEARESGEISEGQYRAEMAKTAAEKETATRLADRSQAEAEGLPADLLASKGINVDAIMTLKERADELTGPEVAEIARSIAGPSVGQGMSDGTPGNAPDGVGPGASDADEEDDEERGANGNGYGAW